VTRRQEPERAGYQSRCAHLEYVGAGGAQAEFLRVPLAAADVQPGMTVAILAARQLGAERIIAISRHEPRQRLALEFGATDIVTECGDEGVARVRELTGG
jgi:threonine dehydrogenase-like Zn-dependent dehydrogenase